MNFSDALNKLKDGVRIQRAGWNGKGVWIAIVDGAEWAVSVYNQMKYPTLPFIMMFTADGSLVPWLASQTDILSEDWQLYTEYTWRGIYVDEKSEA